MVFGEIFASIVVIFFLLSLIGTFANWFDRREKRKVDLEKIMVSDLKDAFSSDKVAKYDSWLAIYGSSAPKAMKEMVENRRNEVYISEQDKTFSPQQKVRIHGTVQENESTSTSLPRSKGSSPR